MANKRPKPEEIVSKLRQVEVLMGQGMSRLDAIRLQNLTHLTEVLNQRQAGAALEGALRHDGGRCCTDQLQLGTRPARDGIQAVRSKLGRPSPVIRLRTRTPIPASVF